MKRAANFNPVYPYGEQALPSTALPPFFSSDGLEEKPGGVLGLKITNPLGFDLDGNLKVKLGDGFSVDVNGALQTSQSITVSSPLAMENDNISLKYGDTLYVDGDNKLQAAKQKPEQTITALAPLQLSNTDQMSLQTGKGLTTQSGQLTLAIDQSLYFTNSNLALKNYTLWTGVETIANAHINSSSLNARVDLVLSKNGDVVHGMVRATGLGAPLLTLNPNNQPTDVSCVVYFNEDGTLNVARSSINKLDFKTNSQAQVNYDPIVMMPNAFYYPRHARNAENSNLRVYEKMPVGMDAYDWPNKFYLLRIKYNAEVENTQDFSIIFNWSRFETAVPKLKTAWGHFSYLTHK